MYANNLLQKYYDGRLMLEVAERLSAYLIYCVKAAIDGCGHLTHVVSISGGRHHVVHPEIIRREWEEMFIDFDDVDATVCITC